MTSSHLPKSLRGLFPPLPMARTAVVKSGFFVNTEKNSVIFCERDSHKGIIIGKNGAMLKKIGSMARRDIEELLEKQANLQLWVKVKKDWRDSDFLLKNFGYQEKDKV